MKDDKRDSKTHFLHLSFFLLSWLVLAFDGEMMNSSTTSEVPVSGNWNSSSPSNMSFAGLESNIQKQFWDWETNTSSSNSHNTCSQHPFIIPTSSFLNFSSASAPINFPSSSYPQITYYPSMTDGFLKREDGCFGVDGGGSGGNTRIGLNLGHRTYFSKQETEVIDRLFRRSRGFCQANQIPRCQVEGCKVDLTNAKHYHRRHRVCEFHSKATRVILAGGLEQRFCQQCSRFHGLAEFDEVKRSCRKRLADHNRRRRKPHPGASLDWGAGKPAPNVIEKYQETEKRNGEASFPLLMTKDHKSNNPEELKRFERKVAVSQMLQKAPALTLGGSGIFHRSCESQITFTHQPFSSPSSLAKDFISPSSCISSHCQKNLLREASHSTSRGPNRIHYQQQPEELQSPCNWVMPCLK